MYPGLPLLFDMSGSEVRGFENVGKGFLTWRVTGSPSTWIFGQNGSIFNQIRAI